MIDVAPPIPSFPTSFSRKPAGLLAFTSQETYEERALSYRTLSGNALPKPDQTFTRYEQLLSTEDSSEPKEGSNTRQASETLADGYREGFLDGYEEGRKEGYQGRHTFKEAYRDGFREGHSNGYIDGKHEGYRGGRIDGALATSLEVEWDVDQQGHALESELNSKNLYKCPSKTQMHKHQHDGTFLVHSVRSQEQNQAILCASDAQSSKDGHEDSTQSSMISQNIIKSPEIDSVTYNGNQSKWEQDSIEIEEVPTITEKGKRKYRSEKSQDSAELTEGDKKRKRATREQLEILERVFEQVPTSPHNTSVEFLTL